MPEHSNRLVTIPEPVIATPLVRGYEHHFEDRIPACAPRSSASMATPVDQEDIWRRYAKDAYHFDKVRMDFWNRRLDIQLLFAGIFSAIVIPLLVETYTFLSEPGPPTYAVWMNAMFTISLVVSIATAVFCLHCKQWLDAYDVDLLRRAMASDISELIHACRTRQYRHRAFEKYHIPRIVGMGALLLYVAIVTFAIGLINFFWHMYPPVGILIALIATAFVILHIITSVQPCFANDSPFKSPFSYILVRCIKRIRGDRRTFEDSEKDDISTLHVSLDADIKKWIFAEGGRKPRAMSVEMV